MWNSRQATHTNSDPSRNPICLEERCSTALGEDHGGTLTLDCMGNPSSQEWVVLSTETTPPHFVKAYPHHQWEAEIGIYVPSLPEKRSIKWEFPNHHSLFSSFVKRDLKPLQSHQPSFTNVESKPQHSLCDSDNHQVTVQVAASSPDLYCLYCLYCSWPPAFVSTQHYQLLGEESHRSLLPTRMSKWRSSSCAWNMKPTVQVRSWGKVA